MGDPFIGLVKKNQTLEMLKEIRRREVEEESE